MPTFFTERPIPPVFRKFKASAVSFNSLMIALSRGKATPNIRAVIKYYRKETRTFGRGARQRHTKTSGFQATLRNVGVTQHCGEETHDLTGGRTTRHRPCSLCCGPERGPLPAPGQLPPAPTPSPLAPHKHSFRHVRGVSLKSLIRRATCRRRRYQSISSSSRSSVKA